MELVSLSYQPECGPSLPNVPHLGMYEVAGEIGEGGNNRAYSMSTYNIWAKDAQRLKVA